jgi:hypothetical protein
MRPPRRTSSSTAVPAAAPPSQKPASADADAELLALFDAWETPTLPPPLVDLDLDLDHAMRDAEPLDARRGPSQRPTEPAPEDPNAAESSTRLRTQPPSPLSDLAIRQLRTELADEFFDGNYAPALVLAEELAARRPDDDAARDFADDCRRMLEKDYLQRIGGPITGVPVLAISMRDLPRYALNHRAGFLVSRVDGESSIEALIDVGAMPRLEALKIIAELVEAGVLQLTGPR